MNTHAIISIEIYWIPNVSLITPAIIFIIILPDRAITNIRLKAVPEIL